MNDDILITELTNQNIAWVGKVGDFLLNLVRKHPDRTDSLKGEPYGFLEYGMALEHWNRTERPENCWFAYDDDQEECPWLMEFKKEISGEFDLPIYSKDEVKIRDEIAKEKATDPKWVVN